MNTLLDYLSKEFGKVNDKILDINFLDLLVYNLL